MCAVLNNSCIECVCPFCCSLCIVECCTVINGNLNKTDVVLIACPTLECNCSLNCLFNFRRCHSTLWFFKRYAENTLNFVTLNAVYVNCISCDCMLVVLEWKKWDIKFIAWWIFISIFCDVLLEFIVVNLVVNLTLSIIIINNTGNCKVCCNNLHFFWKVNFSNRLIALFIYLEIPLVDYCFIPVVICKCEWHVVVDRCIKCTYPHVRKLIIDCSERICPFSSKCFVSFCISYLLYRYISSANRHFIRRLCFSTCN